MTTDPLERIREQLLAGVAQEPRRRARRRAVVGGVVAVVALLVAGLSIAAPWDEEPGDTVVADDGPGGVEGDTPPDGTTDDTRTSIWSIDQPPGWNRAGPELMPNLAEWHSLTLATVELRAGGECAQHPTRALQTMGPADALLTVFFTGRAKADATPWPDGGFPDDSLPESERHPALECAERDDLRIHWSDFERAGAGVYVLVAFGDDVSPEREATTWDTLSSLGPRRATESAPMPTCVVTVPGDAPQEMATTSGDVRPVDGLGWYGTPDLSTPLPTSGNYTRRKSIWFSVHFPGGRAEPAPDIEVTWRRLDDDAEPVTAGSPGTNAHTEEMGWAMMAGLDPDVPGCWEVTATYRDHELSYVYWHPPEHAGPGPTTDGAVGALMEGLDRTSLLAEVFEPSRYRIVVKTSPQDQTEVSRYCITANGGGSGACETDVDPSTFEPVLWDGHPRAFVAFQVPAGIHGVEVTWGDGSSERAPVVRPLAADGLGFAAVPMPEAGVDFTYAGLDGDGSAVTPRRDRPRLTGPG